jgi:murein DD-endopeptidase MepM/ murein hydrolase activator NlpD
VHLENNGLTPYQLLLREATRAGYTIYNSGTKLVMKPIGPNREEDKQPIRISIADVLQLTISSKPSGQTPGGKQGVKGAWGKKPVLKTDPKTGNSEQTTPTPKAVGSSVVNSPVKDQGKMSSDKWAVTTGKVDTGEKVISQVSAESEVARIKDFPLDVTLVGSIDYLAIVPCDLVTIPNMIQFSTRVGTTEFWVYSVKFTLGSVGFGVALNLYQPGVAVPVAQAMSGGNATGNGTIAPTGTDWAHPYPGSVMTAPWGEDRGGRRHAGQDWAGGNNKILAANSGVVTDVEAGCSDNVYSSCGGGYGNFIDIQSTVSGKIMVHRYAHLQSVSVSKGQQIQKGQLLGIEGNSGRSRGRHLHFEIRYGAGYDFGSTIDPVTVGIK